MAIKHQSSNTDAPPHHTYQESRVKIVLKSSISHRAKGRLAILATGGLDSTVLSLLALNARPCLVFAAVQSKDCQNYNRSSIEACRKIARLLDLPLRIIPIRPRDYLRSFFWVVRLLKTPIFDTDLPAAAILLREVRKLGVRTVLSGMGSDETFRLPHNRLRSFQRRMAPVVYAHRQIARSQGVAFNCPFLGEAMIRCNLKMSPSERKKKTAIRNILEQHPELARLLRGRPPAHSLIPSDFLQPLATWVGEKTRPFDRAIVFRKAVLKAWKQYRLNGTKDAPASRTA